MGLLLWLPVTPLAKSLAAPMRIGGMATLDDTIDLDQQLLQTTGVIDSLAYLERFGKVNWEHGRGPEDLLGEITHAEIRKAQGSRGLYIEALFNPESPRAVRAYRLMEGGARFGFSVQGVTLKLRKATHDGFPVEKIDEALEGWLDNFELAKKRLEHINGGPKTAHRPSSDFDAQLTKPKFESDLNDVPS